MTHNAPKNTGQKARQDHKDPKKMTVPETLADDQPQSEAAAVNPAEVGQVFRDTRLKDFAIESSINAIGIGDLAGNIIYVNQAFTRMWGGRREEILGHSVFKFVESKAEAERIIERVLADGGWVGESTGRNKHGDIVHVELSASLVTDGDGRPVSLFCSFVDISERKAAEAALNQAKRDLEIKVEKRTRSLQSANEQLKLEIRERKEAEAQLREKEEELKHKARHLEEVNTALQVLLEQRQKDRESLEENITANVRDLILPYIHELAGSGLNSRQRTCLNVLEANLESIISPFAKKLTGKSLSLTPTQIRVAELIRSGKSTKEIAAMMSISDRAVEFHRNNIREKLGLKKKKINLHTYLLSLS